MISPTAAVTYERGTSPIGARRNACSDDLERELAIRSALSSSELSLLPAQGANIYTFKLQDETVLRLISRRTGEVVFEASCRLGQAKITTSNEHAHGYARGRDVMLLGALYDAEGPLVRFQPKSVMEWLAALEVQVISVEQPTL